MKLGALLLLLATSLSAQNDPADLMPDTVALYVELQEPSLLLQRLRAGHPWGVFADLVPADMAQILDLVAALHVQRAALAFRPGGLLRQRLVMVALQAANEKALSAQLQPLLEESGATAERQGDWLMVSLGRASHKAFRRTLSGQTGALSRREDFRKFRRHDQSGDLRFLADLTHLRPPSAARRMLQQDGGGMFLLAPLLHAAARSKTICGWLEFQGGLHLELSAEAPPLPDALAFAVPRAPRLKRLAAPPGVFLKLALGRDLAAFWTHRKEIVPEQGQAGLAEFQNQLAIFTGGLPAEDVAAALGTSWDLYLALLPQDQTQPNPRYPMGALVVALRDEKLLATELQLAFQTLLGVVNLERARDSLPRFLLETQDHRGVRVQTAGFPHKSLADEQDARQQVRPSLAIVQQRLILGSHPALVRQLIDAVLDQRLESPGRGDSLQLEGHPARKQLQLLLDVLTQQTVLDEGLSPQAARARLERVLRAVSGVRSLSLRLLQQKDTTRLTLDLKAREILGKPARGPR